MREKQYDERINRLIVTNNFLNSTYKYYDDKLLQVLRSNKHKYKHMHIEFYNHKYKFLPIFNVIRFSDSNSNDLVLTAP